MAICANDKGVLVGRMTRLFLAEGCGDAVPDAEDWKYLGSTTSKGVDYSPQTTTSEADTTGGFVSTLVTSSDMTISAEVEIRKNDPSDEFGFHRLVEIYTTELKARRHNLNRSMCCWMLSVVATGIEPASIGALPIAVRAAVSYMTSIFTVAYLLARH